MTFHELLTHYDFSEISQPYLHLWQTNEPKQVKNLDLGKWKKIYRNVQALVPLPSDYYIGLVNRWGYCSPILT